MDNNELMHHGVKGMRWGVRRYTKSRNAANRRYRDAKEDEARYNDRALKYKSASSKHAYKSQRLADRGNVSGAARQKTKAEKYAEKEAEARKASAASKERAKANLTQRRIMDSRISNLNKGAKTKQKFDAQDAKAKAKVKEEKPKEKSIKDMSDAELQAAVNRLQLEQRYSQLNPKKVSLGKKVVTTIIEDVVVPSTTNVAKQLIESELKKQFGLKDDSKKVKVKKHD